MSQSAAKKPRKPCPDLPKGIRCPLCGGTWACLQTWRKKPEPQATKDQQ